MEIISALIALSLLTFVGANLRVTQVQVVFRHGDRMPKATDLYPNDIHNVSVYEPFGLGQLTNIGKKRVYQTGQFLKTRYHELLGSVYTSTAVHAVSTDTDRTKMSLQLLLAGLFPPSEALRWNSDLPWIPIPIHYVPNPLDITMKSYLCPQFQDAEAEIMQFPEVRAKLDTYNGLIQYLTEKTGQDLTSLRQVYRTFNLLVTQKSMNLTMPEWCTDAVLQELRELISFRYDIWSYTTKAKRLGGGPMVRKLIENMHLNRTDQSPKKIYLYSGQKRTISFFLQAQGILEPKIPSYAAAVITEKLQDDYGKFYLRTLLWTGVTEELITLRVPGCEDVCPIQTYLRITRDVIPSDDELDCHWKRLSVDELQNIFEKMTSGA